MFSLFKKKEPKKWREFVAYIDPFMRNSALAGELLQRANSFGLNGKKIIVIVRENSLDHAADEIWFEGVTK